MTTPPDDPPAGSPTGSSATDGGDAPVSSPAAPEVTSGAPPETSASDATQLPVQAIADDEPILPTASTDGALHDAVGAPRRARRKPRPTDDATRTGDEATGDPAAPRRSARTILIVALALIVGLGIAALVLLGRVNSERYYLTCTTTQAVAEQGRVFPPWGTKPLAGTEWRPIPLPANAQCKTQQVDSASALEALFLDLLVERTSATLGAHGFAETLATTGQTASPLDTLAAQLEQALLLSRAPERGDQRKQIERMLGDIEYWRASLRLREASAALAEAARQFDAAALQRPLHISDAGAWAELIRRVTDDLRAGPGGVPAGYPAPPAVPNERPAAPLGTALPVEPDPAIGSGSAPAASPPDAGVPTGGVLL